jgi:hypothetical protein
MVPSQIEKREKKDGEVGASEASRGSKYKRKRSRKELGDEGATVTAGDH